MNPKITVVVCTYNDERTIGPVLEGISKLTYQPREILVIDDASTDGTSQVIRQYPVTVVRNESNRGLAFNQNLGLRKADGDYLALIQSDCVISKADWLEQMLSIMDATVGVVVSQREIPDFKSLPTGARFFNAVAPQELVNGSTVPAEIDYCRGKADLYRVSMLRKIGGWNTTYFTAGEDTDLSMRIREGGFRILLHPTARVTYLFSDRQSTLGGALKKGFLYGRVASSLYRVHGYDGIQSRTYLTLLLACTVLILPLPFQRIAGGALFLYGFTCKIQTGRFGKITFSLLAILAAVPLFLRSPSDFLLTPARALLLAGATYLGYLAAKNTYRNLQKGEKPTAAPGTFVFCVAWRLISGAGYLAGFLGNLRRNLNEPKSLEKTEHLTD